LRRERPLLAQHAAELRAIAERKGFDGEDLVRTSRLTARIDNNAIADGFQIYLHSFVVTASGEWAVVQQGLNDKSVWPVDITGTRLLSAISYPNRTLRSLA
jgi:hypothetical protein